MRSAFKYAPIGLAILLGLSCHTDASEWVCGDYAALGAVLKNDYGEDPLPDATEVPGDQLLQMFVSPTGSFSVVLVKKTELLACVIATGKLIDGGDET